MTSYLLFRLDPRLEPAPAVPKAGRPAREVEIEAQRPDARSVGLFGAP